MTTFGTMITRIAAELERSDMGTAGAPDVIGTHINDAIRCYKARNWWFLQEPTSAAMTTTMATSDSYVTLPTRCIQLDTVKITVSGSPLDMRAVMHTEMEQLHEGSVSTGQPYVWTQWAKRLRVYPTPDTNYTITVTGLFEEATTLSASADTNDWMTDGELLIRRTAKKTLLRDYLNDPAWQACGPGIAEAIDSLDREHMRRMSTRTIKSRM